MESLSLLLREEQLPHDSEPLAILCIVGKSASIVFLMII